MFVEVTLVREQDSPAVLHSRALGFTLLSYTLNVVANTDAFHETVAKELFPPYATPDGGQGAGRREIGVTSVQEKRITWISICIAISFTVTLSGGQGAKRERVSHHGESVELTTAEVQERVAALGGVPGDAHEGAALTSLNLVVGTGDDWAVDGGGGDGHLVDLAAPQIPNGAGVGRRVAGSSVSIRADGPGGVIVRARLRPTHIHHVGATVQLSGDIFHETGS
ncbi:hypothetical protein FQN60_016156, partial [Etheostoma spectabile]